MPTIDELQNQINEIKERNKKVEADKTWETSWIRKIIVFILTYLVIVVFFLISELPSPFINAIVPALAFVISTLTLSLFKKIWLKNN
ncbi:MAG: hypothetical protein ACNFW9_02530 [Candidatus Kerfeldbacteria bacterium]|jgi:polyferredoxin